jgi:hypothetical protein
MPENAREVASGPQDSRGLQRHEGACLKEDRATGQTGAAEAQR